MFWILGILAVLGGLVAVSRRRNRHAPTYSASTHARIDDQLSQREGNNMANRFYDGGSI